MILLSYSFSLSCLSFDFDIQFSLGHQSLTLTHDYMFPGLALGLNDLSSNPGSAAA